MADPLQEMPPGPLTTAEVSPTPASSPTDSEAVVDGRCRELRTGPVSISAGRGGVSGGVAVIERFTFGVYVLRSATAARSVVDTKGAVTATPELQEWINSRPQGTRHCSKITGLPGDTWKVEITEIRPNIVAPERFYQIIRTFDDPSRRTWITSITADPEKGK